MPRALLLFERDLASLPVDLTEYPALEVLDLNRNPRLGRLPDLSGAARLRYLYAEDVGLAELPALPALLEYLNIANNRLTRLPALELPRLRELRAHGKPARAPRRRHIRRAAVAAAAEPARLLARSAS